MMAFAWRNKAVLLWVLGLLAAVGVIARSSFTTDMGAFLPQNPSKQQQLLVDQITQGSLSRMLVMGLEGGTAEQRSQASQLLAEKMRATQRFAIVANGASDAFERDQKFVFENRYALSPAVDAKHFSVDGLRHAIGQSVQALASPAGMLLKQIFPHDPTGEVLELLSQMAQSEQPADGDVWVSSNGQRALLMAQTAAAGSDTAAQEQTLAALQQAFRQVQAEQPELETVQLLVSGAPVFAVEASNTIRSEAGRLAIGGFIAVTILLLWAYRSPITVGVSFLPVLSGVLAGMTAVSLFYGVIHGVTMGFGTTLIGEAIDYSIYYFVQSARGGAQGGLSSDEWSRRFWPTIRLGLLTSVCGVSTLIFAGFPGLSQLGVYSIFGLSAAALVTRFVLPRIPVPAVNWSHAHHVGAWLAGLLAQAQRVRFVMWVSLLGASLVIGYNVWHKGHIWNKRLDALNPVSQEAQALDAALRRDLGNPDTTALVVITAPDLQAVLQKAERASGVLQQLTAQGGLIAGFETPTRFLPSDATQRSRLQALPPADVLQQRMQQAVQGLPVDAAVLQPFVQDVAQAREKPLLTRQSLQGTAMALALEAMLQQHATHATALLPVRGLNDAEGNPQSVNGAAVQQALAAAGLAQAGSDEVLFIDIGQETAELYERYFQRALYMALVSLLAILMLLALTLRSVRRMVRVLLPLLVAELVVVAGLLLAGQQLTLMHFIGLLLVVAVGSNYTLFFDRYDLSDDHQTLTLLSLLAANLTTVCGFGMLAFSQFPVLNAIGRTVAPGAMLALVLAAIAASGGTANAGKE